MSRPIMCAGALLFLWSVQAWAQGYTYHTIDVPFANTGEVRVTGLTEAGSLAGQARRGNGRVISWFYDGTTGQWQIVQPKGLPGLLVEDINRWPDTWGTYTTHGQTAAFLRTSTWTETIRVPGAVRTTGTGLNDSRQGVGAAHYPDGTIGGYIYDAIAPFLLEFSLPGAWRTEPRGVNSGGWIVGTFEDATGIHGFLLYFLDTEPTVIDAPCGGHWTVVSDLNDHFQMVVQCGVDDVLLASYVYDGETWTPIKVPGSEVTWVTRLTNAGRVAGYYRDPDGSQYGFVATPTPAAGQVAAQ
jgi:hypothetical protein